MKRARGSYEDVQSLSDVTDSLEPWEPRSKHISLDPFLDEIEYYLSSARKCSSCDIHLPEARGTEFLCSSSVCSVNVFHLCGRCKRGGVSLQRCPRGFGCEE